MFKVIFGDSYDGNFKYDRGTGLETVSSPSGNNNYVGDCENDKVATVDMAFVHNLTSLTIKFFCNPTSSGDGFCAISDYYILTYKNLTCAGG